MSKIFETVSFHMVKPCDFACKFCYATFDDFKVDKQLTLEECMLILEKLREAGVQKITFAGGEPMLYKNIDLVIEYAKKLGFTTSIISNGSMLTYKFLMKMTPYLDWVGVSIDSLDQETNVNIGRTRKNGNYFIDYPKLAHTIKNLGYKFKVNTVVNRFNHEETLRPFIERFEVDRWKVFQTLQVKGQNDKLFEHIKCSGDQFKAYIDRNATANLVPENNEVMYSSYLLIDPLGRFFEDTKREHTYSDSLLEHDVDHCLSQISLSRENFINRGGIYKW